MNEKDKDIIVTSWIATIDALVTYVCSQNPYFLVAWSLCLVLGQANMKYREKRVVEWVENIKDNLSIFTAELLEDEIFQEWFVYLFQKYISERNIQKRKIVKNIFSGFTYTFNRWEFELEKLCNILNALSFEDLKILKIWADGSIEQWDKSQGLSLESYSSPPLNSLQIGKYILHGMKWMNEFTDEQYTYEKLKYLVSAGLLAQEIPKTTYHTDNSFTISTFGKSFVQFIKDF